jgi:hypothetical protein
MITVSHQKVANAQLQSLPVLIDYNGPARVTEFFVARTKTSTSASTSVRFDQVVDADAVVEAAFRGRVLKGAIRHLIWCEFRFAFSFEQVKKSNWMTD